MNQLVSLHIHRTPPRSDFSFHGYTFFKKEFEGPKACRASSG